MHSSWYINNLFCTNYERQVRKPVSFQFCLCWSHLNNYFCNFWVSAIWKLRAAALLKFFNCKRGINYVFLKGKFCFYMQKFFCLRLISYDFFLFFRMELWYCIFYVIWNKLIDLSLSLVNWKWIWLTVTDEII